MNSRQLIEHIIYGRERSLLVGPVLLLFSLLYRSVLLLRGAAYRTGLLRTRSATVRVVSVGNITLGGTGKTPTVIAVAELCLAKGKRPAVVSRGYGRPDESSVLVVSDGAGNLLPPQDAGDEPAMIGNRLQQVPVVVGSDRYEAARTAVERFRPDLLILDDGYQHLRLKRDLNIALVDAADPFGNKRLFPAGILREPLSALKRADLVVLTRSDEAADLDATRRILSRYTKARVLQARYRPLDLVEVATGAVRPLDILRGAQVAAFAGIARPDSLERILAGLGAEVVALRSFPDHHRFTHGEMQMLMDEAARSAALLVTTEKDGVKLRGMARQGVWMLRVSLEVTEREIWEEALCPQP